MFMRQQFPQFQYTWKYGTGIWKGTLQPREISSVYSVTLKYNVTEFPKIWVVEPKIKSNAPHRYQDNSLCLWWYKEWIWSPSHIISKTIVPWAALWLYYYELWLDAGEWLAPAAPHGPELRRSEQ